MSVLLPEWLLATALTLFVVDLFIPTELMSWCGVVALSGYVTWRIGVPAMWSILVFVFALLIFSAVYYFVFRMFISATFARFLQRKAPPEAVEQIIGAVGKIHFVEGKPMFRWNGDELWPLCNPSLDLVEGVIVVVTSLSGGLVEVKPFTNGECRS